MRLCSGDKPLCRSSIAIARVLSCGICKVGPLVHVLCMYVCMYVHVNGLFVWLILVCVVGNHHKRSKETLCGLRCSSWHQGADKSQVSADSRYILRLVAHTLRNLVVLLCSYVHDSSVCDVDLALIVRKHILLPHCIHCFL